MLHLKDFIVGKQKEDGLQGAEAYAYARQMQAIRESNPLATERVVKLRYSFMSYIFTFGSLWVTVFMNNLTLGGLLAGIAIVIALYGKLNATEQLIQR